MVGVGLAQRDHFTGTRSGPVLIVHSVVGIADSKCRGVRPSQPIATSSISLSLFSRTDPGTSNRRQIGSVMLRVGCEGETRFGPRAGTIMGPAASVRKALRSTSAARSRSATKCLRGGVQPRAHGRRGYVSGQDERERVRVHLFPRRASGGGNHGLQVQIGCPQIWTTFKALRQIVPSIRWGESEICQTESVRECYMRRGRSPDVCEKATDVTSSDLWRQGTRQNSNRTPGVHRSGKCP